MRHPNDEDDLANGITLAKVAATVIPIVCLLVLSICIPGTGDWSWNTQSVWIDQELRNEKPDLNKEDMVEVANDSPNKIKLYWYEVNHFYEGLYSADFMTTEIEPT